MADLPILTLGNKNYSSWSMRPWLALRWTGIPFKEVVVPMAGGVYGKSAQPEILAASPSGRVPALQVGDVAIWDSLAISEWAAETKPHSQFLPLGPAERAVCRSLAAEMHSGFNGIRRDLSMNIRRRPRSDEASRALSDDAKKDIARLEEAWADARARFGAGGPYLFGPRSMADAFFTPVATRFRTYGIVLSPAAQIYCDTLLADPDFKVWERDALAEPWSIAIYDNA